MKAKSRIRFVNKDKNQFFSTLKARVDAYFVENNLSKHANATMIWKTVILLACYFVPFVWLLVFQPVWPLSLLLWALMGFGVAGIGMSIMHDANHGAYSANELVNKWMGHTLNLAGGSVCNWKMQHNVLHHMFTNIVPLDEDIKDRAILKFSPHAAPKPIHKFQKFYAFVFYGILTLYWVVAKDFVQHFQFMQSGVNTDSKSENGWMLAKIIFDKILYFGVIIGLPIMLGISAGQVILGFLLMHFIAGIVLTVVFQLAHTVEGTDHPIPQNGIIENDWAIHQLRTTVNFSRDNKLLSWYLGGLNFQVEHHLFPKICHVHYPNIAPIVKQTAEEFGLEYMENPTFMSALASHIAALERFGTPSLNDAIG
ncbi:MAG: acyl-CoA desaturase [Spirosomaceae bacterium]|jgi:linoleoyl-CoA desaturase|nr:acyl-CoA desaturase [Spirosomataceae bacterium]